MPRGLALLGVEISGHGTVQRPAALLATNRGVDRGPRLVYAHDPAAASVAGTAGDAFCSTHSTAASIANADAFSADRSS